MKTFFQSKAWASMDPKKPETARAAVGVINVFLKAEPRNRDVYFLRATVECFAGASPQEVLRDIAASTASRDGASPMALSTPRDRHVLSAKMNFDLAQYDEALRDLDNAISEDFSAASEVIPS